MPKSRVRPTIRDEVKAIRTKLEIDPSGQSLTRKEKALEVSKIETSYLLSSLARRTIKPTYLNQLTRGETPRLQPERLIGNTYTYKVESLLSVKFNEKKEGTHE